MTETVVSTLLIPSMSSSFLFFRKKTQVKLEGIHFGVESKLQQLTTHLAASDIKVALTLGIDIPTNFSTLLRLQEVTQEDVSATFTLKFSPVIGQTNDICISHEIRQLNHAVGAIEQRCSCAKKIE